MVKRRGRKQSSEYESESGSSYNDEYEDLIEYEPPTKKYSLRERKPRKGSLAQLQYDSNESDEGEADVRVGHSDDDEDFEVEPDMLIEEFDEDEQYEKISKREESFLQIKSVEPVLDPSIDGSNGLIDFEDIIRAEIVVNKRKIDHDKMVKENELKQNKTEDVESKIMSDDETEEEPQLPNVETLSEANKPLAPEDGIENVCSVTSKDTDITENNIKMNYELPETILNSQINANTTETKTSELNTADENQSKINNTVLNSKTVQSTTNSDSNNAKSICTEDDDVIVIETKHEIIVLDD